jgi:PEP-CTERM motif
MESLNDYLVADRVGNLTGWSLPAATGISADGRTIAGNGFNPSGQTEAWIATVPEPSSMPLAAAGLLSLAVVAWRRGCLSHEPGSGRMRLAVGRMRLAS